MQIVNLWGETEEIAAPSAQPALLLEGFCCPTCGKSNLSKEEMRKMAVGEGRRRHLEDVHRTCGTVIRYVEEQWHRESRLREQRLDRIEAEMKRIASATRDWVRPEEVDALEAQFDAICAETPDEMLAARRCLAETQKLGKIAEERRRAANG